MRVDRRAEANETAPHSGSDVRHRMSENSFGDALERERKRRQLDAGVVVPGSEPSRSGTVSWVAPPCGRDVKTLDGIDRLLDGIESACVAAWISHEPSQPCSTRLLLRTTSDDFLNVRLDALASGLHIVINAPTRLAQALALRVETLAGRLADRDVVVGRIQISPCSLSGMGPSQSHIGGRRR